MKSRTNAAMKPSALVWPVSTCQMPSASGTGTWSFSASSRAVRRVW
jgi:hypothetical protein